MKKIANESRDTHVSYKFYVENHKLNARDSF